MGRAACYNRGVMPDKPVTVDAYLAGLPDDRRAALQAVRETILKNLPKGYAEGIQYGMIGYYVPHGVYPAGYHADPKQPLPFAGLASQKNHMALYLMCVYGDPKLETWFRSAWKETGKKLDMGKSCVRFKSIDDVPLKLIGQTLKRVPVTTFIERYEANLKTAAVQRKSKRSAKQTVSSPSPRKRGAVKKGAVKKGARRVTAGKRKSTKK